MIRTLRSTDRGEWLRLLALLYPDHAQAEHEPFVDAYLSGLPYTELLPTVVFVATRSDGIALGGFLELSLRNYAEGCDGTTPYVESWYVDEDMRGKGVGRELMRAAEQWSRERGYAEMASDSDLDNVRSHSAHRAIGFHEVERTVHFRKDLQQ